jgi:O-antigen/teichoic acid export membrane protein
VSKTFISNLILIVFLNLLVKPFFILGIDAEVQNQVGSETYGLYFALLNFSFLFNILLDFGITNYNTKTLAEHPHLAKNQLGSILGLRSILFIVYAVFTLGIGMIIGYQTKDLSLLSVLILNQFFVAVILFMRSNFAGLHRFKLDAVFSVLDRVLLIIICSYLLWFRNSHVPFQIEWFIWSQTAAYGFSAAVALIIGHRTIGKAKVKIKKLFSIVILRQAFPYALLILLMMIYNRMDSVMLERIHPDGATQAGIYAQGFRLLDAVNMFALLFAGLLLPIFARMLSKKESINELIQHAGSLLFVAACIFSVTAYFYATDIIEWRYNEHILASSNSFKILIISFIPVSITYIFGTLLTANGSLKSLNIMALSGLALNFVLNIILIPKHGAAGAAWATLCTQIFTAIFQLYLAVKMLKIRFETLHLLRVALFVLILIFGSRALHVFSASMATWLVLISIATMLAGISGVLPIKKSIALLLNKKREI